MLVVFVVGELHSCSCNLKSSHSIISMLRSWMVLFGVFCGRWRAMLLADIQCQGTGKCSCELSDGTGKFDLSAVDQGPIPV